MLKSFIVATIVSAPLAALAAEVDPALLRALHSDEEVISTVIHLNRHYDLKNLPTRSSATQLGRGRLVARTLRQHTLDVSKRLRDFLNSPEAEGVKEVTPLWITNSLRVKAPAAVIEKLMAMNGIASITLDAPKEIHELFDAGASYMPRSWAVETGWGVEKMRAPALWEAGIAGEGALVAVIDSGVNVSHPDLAPNIWQNPGETGRDRNGENRATNSQDDDGNGYVDDVVGWNFEDKSNDPKDINGHGTQAAGLVAGNGKGGVRTGVAPKANIMALRSCCLHGTKIFESNTWEAIQYAVENGAKVISMSLSVKHVSDPSYAKWRRAGEVVLAAEVIHVNSAGNRGSFSAPNNIGAPATNPPAWIHPSQTSGPMTSMITVGATDQEDKLRRYSSTGPVTWEGIDGYKDFPYAAGAKPGLFKPEVCGPSEVPSTSMDGKSYTHSFGGTSSATPQVAGVVALLVSARPNLTVAQATEALQNSAVEVEGKFTNKCGAGRVSPAAALEYIATHF